MVSIRIVGAGLAAELQMEIEGLRMLRGQGLPRVTMIRVVQESVENRKQDQHGFAV